MNCRDYAGEALRKADGVDDLFEPGAEIGVGYNFKVAVVGEPQVRRRPEIRNGTCKRNGGSTGADRQALNARRFQRRKIKLDVFQGKWIIGRVWRYEHLEADLLICVLKYNRSGSLAFVVFLNGQVGRVGEREIEVALVR